MLCAEYGCVNLTTTVDEPGWCHRHWRPEPPVFPAWTPSTTRYCQRCGSVIEPTAHHSRCYCHGCPPRYGLRWPQAASQRLLQAATRNGQSGDRR